MVAHGRLKTKKSFKLLDLKVVAVAYERQTLISAFKYSDLTYNIQSVVTENIHTPPRKVVGNSEGEGRSEAKISEGSGGSSLAFFSEGGKHFLTNEMILT